MSWWAARSPSAGRAAAAGVALMLVVLVGVLWGAGRNAVGREPHAAAARAPSPAGTPLSVERVRAILEEEARSGDPLALLELALFQERAGDREGSMASLVRLARRHPKFARGRHYLGVAYLTLDRPAAAHREFLAATRLAPRDVEARGYLGMALQALGKVEEAAAEYRRAQRLDPDAPTPYFLLAQMDNGPAGYPDALRNLERFIARTARPAPGYHLMAQIYSHKGERDRAIVYARRAVEDDPDNSIYWHYLGQIYHGMSGPESLPAALRCYHEAARRNPADGRIWFDLGRAYAASHRWPDAVQAFRRARVTDPQNGETHYHLGHALQAMGDRQEARRQLGLYRIYTAYVRRQRPIQEALARRPNDPALKLQLAELCLEFRQYEPAREAAREVLALRPDSARARRLLARADAGLARRVAAPPPAPGTRP